MAETNPAILSFLSKNGLDGAQILALPGDASHRHYARLIKSNQKFMLMIAPPEKENIGAFIKVDNILRDAGLNAPQIYAEDLQNGLLLLEDFGDDLFSRVLRRPDGEEKDLYAYAVKLLDFLPSDASGLPPYTSEKMLEEAVAIIDWLATDADRDEFLTIWRKLIASLDSSNNRLVLRDYHADNLMWMPGREGLQKIGLLDFQDAVIGHPAYDLVSLLEDARRDVAESLVAKVLKSKNSDFRRNYYILGAQRNCKIVGYFHRLDKRDGKSHYLNYLPRVWRHLRGDLEHPALAELKTWMQNNVSDYAA